MDDKIIISYVIIALLTVGSLVAMVLKFIQPINELKIAIQKLTDSIDNLIKENETLKARINEHGKFKHHQRELCEKQCRKQTQNLSFKIFK